MGGWTGSPPSGRARALHRWYSNVPAPRSGPPSAPAGPKRMVLTNPGDPRLFTPATPDTFKRRGQHAVVVSETRGTEYRTSRDSSKCTLRNQPDSTYINQARVLAHSLRTRVENAKEAMRAGREFDRGHQRAIIVDIEALRECLPNMKGESRWIDTIEHDIREAERFARRYAGPGEIEPRRLF